MPDRPYTVLSCAMSIDGYIAGAAMKPLPLSNAADLDRVDAVRASCDAILVGAATVRGDQPRLLLRSEARRTERLARGRPSSPIKVTVTGGGRLDASANVLRDRRHREGGLLCQRRHEPGVGTTRLRGDGR